MTNAPLAAGTNRAFSHTVETQAPREAVWRLWTDPTTWKDWDLGLKDAVGPTPLTLGDRGQIVPNSGPTSAFEVVAFDDGQSYAFETNLPLAKLRMERSFIGGGETTQFQHTVSFSGLLSGLWASQFGPGFRRALPPTMESLAAQAEAQSAEAAGVEAPE